jgi:hypothetical protein
MSKKNKNPYREGSSYANIFGYIQRNQVVTRQELIAQNMSVADITVILSPRAEGASRGDCRGNMSAQGHLYFMQKLKKVKGQPQKFRLRWRNPVLEVHKRTTISDTVIEKATATTAVTEATAVTETTVETTV